MTGVYWENLTLFFLIIMQLFLLTDVSGMLTIALDLKCQRQILNSGKKNLNETKPGIGNRLKNSLKKAGGLAFYGNVQFLEKSALSKSQMLLQESVIGLKKSLMNDSGNFDFTFVFRINYLTWVVFQSGPFFVMKILTLHLNFLQFFAKN